MATFGNTTTPGSGNWFDDTGNSQYGTVIGSSFPGGYVTDINVWLAAHTGTANVKYAIWGTGGSLLWNSAVHNIGTTLSWRNNGVSGTPPQPGLFLAAGTNLRLGFWTDGQVQWDFESSGSVQFDRSHADVADFSADATEGTTNALGIYLDYIPLSAPTITDVSPAVAAIGQLVTITGTQFTYATDVKIGGVSASFTVTDDSHLTATVPVGAAQGVTTVQVFNDAGNASHAITIGTLYGDNGTAWVAGVLPSGDSGAGWPAGTTVWADNGAAWVQIG